MTLRGRELAFTLNLTLDRLGLTRHEFSGKVDGNQIVGTVKVIPVDQAATTVPWRARRTGRSDYFGPTGTIVQPPARSDWYEELGAAAHARYPFTGF